MVGIELIAFMCCNVLHCGWALSKLHIGRTTGGHTINCAIFPYRYRRTGSGGRAKGGRASQLMIYRAIQWSFWSPDPNFTVFAISKSALEPVKIEHVVRCFGVSMMDTESRYQIDTTKIIMASTVFNMVSYSKWVPKFVVNDQKRLQSKCFDADAFFLYDAVNWGAVSGGGCFKK